MNKILKHSILILTLLGVMVACKEESKSKQIVRPVKTETPTRAQQSNNTIMLPASINELRETKLSFRVGGPLIVLNDVVGSYVREGEVIAKLDPRDFKIAIEATETRYKLAKAEYERYKSLMEKKSVSKSVFDQMETNYKLAKTDYESASNAFCDTEIKAPFSGYINKVFVNNFEEISPGTPIISLLDMSEFEVNAWISTDDVTAINKHTQFSCLVKNGEKEVRISGKLKEIGNKTSLSKQSLPITIIIDSPDDIKLRAGMTTYLEIANGSLQEQALFLVPISSIFTKDNCTNVWVFNAKTQTVSAKKVTTRKVLDNGKMEIIKGLSGNENIVIAGVHYLFEGQTVKKMEAVSKSNVGNKL